MALFLARCAEGEVERGTGADSAFGPDAPAVAFDDPLHAGQADAGAGNSMAATSSLRSNAARFVPPRDTRDSCSRSSMSVAIRSLAAWMRPA
jgi:hypothetical protein